MAARRRNPGRTSVVEVEVGETTKSGLFLIGFDDLLRVCLIFFHSVLSLP